MSESQNPTDTQALVQSMLQKLKLQQGRENQLVLNPYAPSSPEEQQHEERRASPPLNKVKISPVSHLTKNGSPFNFNLSAVGNSVGFQDGDQNGGITSFPSQKHISEGRDTSWPGIPPTGVKQLFPTQTHKDAEITSCETSDAERTISSSEALPNNFPANTYSISNKGPNLDQDQQFTPRVYNWSQKSSEEQRGKVLQFGNGGFDAVNAPTSSNNNNSFRNEKSSERKPRRWTSKIKERWRHRQGSFGKKGKEDGDPASEQKNAQITDVSLENPFIMLHKDGEETLSPTDTPPAQEEVSTVEVPTRSTSDFDFGLGSFSLLEEITRGQEWAKFINPNLTTTTTQLEESQRQTNSPSSMWSFNGAESSSQATAQHSPDAFSPVSMDVSEGKHLQLSDQRQMDQSEPMDDGVNQSALRPAENGLDQQSTSLTSAKARYIDRLYGSVQRSRLQLNRKRQHQSQAQQMSNGEETDGSVTNRHAMDESEPQQTAPESASSSFYNPSAAPAPAPRGVLKHSISWDRERQSKRRRMEVNHRVHFSEEVVTIVSPVLDYSDSEEEEEEEGEEGEDEVVNEEAEVEQAPMEDGARARRHALPHWIRALKRKNTGKKHG